MAACPEVRLSLTPCAGRRRGAIPGLAQRPPSVVRLTESRHRQEKAWPGRRAPAHARVDDRGRGRLRVWRGTSNRSVRPTILGGSWDVGVDAVHPHVQAEAASDAEREAMWVSVSAGQCAQRETRGEIGSEPLDRGRHQPYGQAGCCGGVRCCPCRVAGQELWSSRSRRRPGGGDAAPEGGGRTSHPAAPDQGRTAWTHARPGPPGVDAHGQGRGVDLGDCAGVRRGSIRPAALGVDEARVLRWRAGRHQVRSGGGGGRRAYPGNGRRSPRLLDAWLLAELRSGRRSLNGGEDSAAPSCSRSAIIARGWPRPPPERSWPPA